MTNHATAAAECGPPFNSNLILTVTQLCVTADLDRKTVGDRLKKGRYPNAWKDATGRKGWNIPIQDVVAAGDLDPAQVVDVPAMLDSLRESKEVGELRARIAELENALGVQTALADERRSTIATLQSVLAALTAPGDAR